MSVYIICIYIIYYLYYYILFPLIYTLFVFVFVFISIFFVLLFLSALSLYYYYKDNIYSMFFDKILIGLN